jgi:hypothetical protein
MPAKPPKGTGFRWGHDRPELKGMTKAEQVKLLTETKTWREVVRPLCQEIDEKTRGDRGPRRAYSAEQLEIALLYGRAFGVSVPEAVHELLAGDSEPGRPAEAGRPAEPGAREALGFSGGQRRPGQKKKVGVPSVSTLRRHRRRLSDQRRAELYRLAVADLVELFVADPENHEECRLLYMDGTSVFTRYQARQFDQDGQQTNEPKKKDGQLVRYDEDGKRLYPATAIDAGYRPESKNGHKGGSGWQPVVMITALGTPLGYRIEKLQGSERAMGRAIVADYGAQIMPKLVFDDPSAVSVFTADSGFYAREFKRELQLLGVVPNIHRNKHETDGGPSAAAVAKDDDYLPVEAKAHQKWFANGHYELRCECGQGKVAKKAYRDSRGQAIVSVDGRCKRCSNITIQAGRWRRAKNAPSTIQKRIHDREAKKIDALIAQRKQAGQDYADLEAQKKAIKVPDTAAYMKKMEVGDPPEAAEWSFGNFLTFNDPEAAAYGKGRMGHNEGFNSALGKRFGVGQEKTWHKTEAAVEADLAQALCLAIALSIYQAQASRGGAGNVVSIKPRQTQAPPGVRRAA